MNPSLIWLTDKIGARPIAVTGFAIVAAATVPFAFAGADTNSWLLALSLVVRGFGLGAVTIPVMAVAFLGLDKEQISHSSVVTRMMQQIGGSFGTAVLAVILSAALSARHGDLSAAFDIAFCWATGFSVVAVLLSLWLPGAPRMAPAPQADITPAETIPVEAAPAEITPVETALPQIVPPEAAPAETTPAEAAPRSTAAPR